MGTFLRSNVGILFSSSHSLLPLPYTTTINKPGLDIPSLNTYSSVPMKTIHKGNVNLWIRTSAPGSVSLTYATIEPRWLYSGQSILTFTLYISTQTRLSLPILHFPSFSLSLSSTPVLISPWRMFQDWSIIKGCSLMAERFRKALMRWPQDDIALSHWLAFCRERQFLTDLHVPPFLERVWV